MWTSLSDHNIPGLGLDPMSLRCIERQFAQFGKLPIWQIVLLPFFFSLEASMLLLLVSFFLAELILDRRNSQILISIVVATSSSSSSPRFKVSFLQKIFILNALNPKKAEFFFSHCTYTSLPLNGRARNYFYLFYLPGYERSSNLSCLDPLNSYPYTRGEKRPFGLSWNQTQDLLLHQWPLDHSSSGQKGEATIWQFYDSATPIS